MRDPVPPSERPIPVIRTEPSAEDHPSRAGAAAVADDLTEASAASATPDTSDADADLDVIIIGGGPAGSACALTLARLGRRVLVLEKAAFPRFHLGESLLPYGTALLRRLGVLDAVAASGAIVKRGAEFCSTDPAHFRRVDFVSRDAERADYAFQVERAQFDTLLLDQAAQAGAQVIQQARVIDLILAGDGRVRGVVYVAHADQEPQRVTARWVVDASGRAGVIAQRFQLRQANPRLRMVALFRHYADCDERANPGFQGDIQVGYHADGWVWAIPIHETVLSVGVVTARTMLPAKNPMIGADQVFAEHVGRIPRIAQRLPTAAPAPPVRMETDFCYGCQQAWGPGFVLVGDAACFADPVFSAGVFLGMATGERAGQTIHDLLDDQEATASRSTVRAHAQMEREAAALRAYDRFLKTGYDTYFRVIYGFYAAGCDFRQYLKWRLGRVADANYWITRTLAGDFWSAENPITTELRSERAWDTFAPYDPLYGCPVYGDPARSAG